MKKWLIRSIAIISAFTLTSQTAPLGVLAIGNPPAPAETSAGVPEEIPVGGDVWEIPTIQYEETSLREENGKHFRLENGTMLAVSYPQPVHYQDEDGGWQEYDNTLVDAPALLSAENGGDPDGQVGPVNSDKTVRLSKKAKKNMFTLSDDGGTLTWGYLGANKSALELVRQESDRTNLSAMEKANDRFLNLQNTVQEGWYRDLYEGVDLQVLVTPRGLKENLILKNASTRRSFDIEYKTDKLTAVQADEQTVLLKDSAGNTVFTLSAPVMTDAGNHVSAAVKLTLLEQKNKKLTVRVTADDAWLDDEGRQYPVTVDPEVIIPTESPLEIYSYKVNPTGTYTGEFLAGKGSDTYGERKIVGRINSFPTLRPGDTVVDARLNMSYRGYVTGGRSDIRLALYSVGNKWTRADLDDGEAVPQIGSNIEDYVVASQESTWVITDLVKSWMDGSVSNNGFLIQSESTGMGYASYTYSSSGDTVRPHILMTYLNSTGLEGYRTYHSVGAGMNGSVSVNDCTGNLVVTEKALTTTGARVPTNISLTYNGNQAPSQFPYGGVAGRGWQMSFSQRITEPTADQKLHGYKYIYTDGDGTQHYFRKKTGSTTEWVDEEGLDLTITEADGGINLTDKKDNVMHFYLPTAAQSGLLQSVKDNDGNTARYNNTRLSTGQYAITSIVDGSGRTTSITYDDKGATDGGGRCRMTSITGPDGYKVTFEYPASATNLLTKVKYPDGTYTRYEYDGMGRLQLVERPDLSRVEITYNSLTQATGLKERTTTDSGASYTEGQRLTIAYGSRTTTFTDRKGRQEVYQFDHMGRTVSVIGDDGSISGAEYHPDDPGSDKEAGAGAVNNNKVTASNGSTKYANNLLRDPSAEGSDYYYVNDSYSTVDSSTAFIGYKSLKIRYSSAKSGFHAQRLSAPGGKSYTLSAYVKTQGVSSSSATGGASMHIAWFNGDTYVGGKSMSYGLKGDHGWTRMSLTAEVPAGTDKIGVYFDMNSAAGTVWFDAMQLEEGKSANDVNLVDDSDMKMPNAWMTSNARDFSGGVCRFTPNIDASVNNGYVHQTIQVNAADVCFNVYGTASADSTSLLHDGRAFSMELAIEYADGQGEWQTQPFNESLNDWQHVNLNVRPKRKGVVVSKVGVYFVYRDNANAAAVDNMMVTVDRTGTTYDYDSEGNLISAADNAERNQAYTFNNAHELTEYTDAKNETYQYHYQGNSHQVISAVSPQLLIGYTYSYDDAGNVTRVDMNSNCSHMGMAQDGSLTMSAATEYDTKKNYVVKQTDTRGKSVSYRVNENNGLTSLMASPRPGSTDGTLVSTSYSYNMNNYLPTGISRTADGQTYRNLFGYDSLHRLTSITHNGFDYTFGYDQWGNRRESRAAGQLLSSNTYNANNGTLAKTTYGNGDFLSYDYDRYDRVTKKTSEKGVLAEYVYNNKGLPARVTDRTRPGDVRVTEYQYDLLGRLETAYQTGSRPVESRYTYDKVNRPTGEQVVTPGGEHAWGVSYGKDNQVTESTQGMFTYKYTYDGLGRRNMDSLYVNGNTQIGFTRYAYEKGWGGNQSPLVESLSYYKPGYLSQGTLQYTYDDAGNILTVKENGVLKASYTYDAMGQLTREDNVWANRTYRYFYDGGGNLTTVQENRYTTGELHLPDFIKNTSYSYDSVWKDKLTSIDGQSIAYDGLGNPLNWPGVPNLGWDNGRQLTALRKGAGTNEYSYDESGLRSGKRINSKIVSYDRDANGKLVHEKNGTHDLFYYYDPDGSVGSISYDYTRYAFRKNLQGDVIAILDTNGDPVARYAYDAWGKVLSVTDKDGNAITDANHVANINPIRYRGYYYDTETGWYYLNSRYYDPSVKRFINADGLINLADFLGSNIYVYCNNNPVMASDRSGYITSYDIYGSHRNPGGGYQYGFRDEDYITNGVVTIQTDINLNWKNNGGIESPIQLATPNRRPNTGEPGSTYKAPNGDERTYGPDGMPQHDYDHDDHGQPDSHPHDENGGHNHDWDWSKTPPRGQPYIVESNPVAGVAMITVCVIGIVVVASDDVTGIGVADNALYGPLGSGVGKGLVMIFG